MKTKKDYRDLRLKCNAALWAHVFEKLSSNSLKSCRLYPGDCLRAPALSWNAMLQMKKVELEPIPDLDLYILFEKIDGVSYISNGHSNVYNKCFKSYDQESRIKTFYMLRREWFIWLWLQVSSNMRLQMGRSKQFDLNKFTTNISKAFVLEVDFKHPNKITRIAQKLSISSR